MCGESISWRNKYRRRGGIILNEISGIGNISYGGIESISAAENGSVAEKVAGQKKKYQYK